MSTPTRTRPLAPAPPRLRWSRLPGARVGIVLWGGLALVDVGTLAHAPRYAELVWVVLLVTVASTGAGVPTAVGAAVVGWLVVDGFVTHRYGDLGFDGASDLLRLALLVGCAIVGSRVRR